MSTQPAAELLRSLGIDPNTVERFYIDCRVGQPPLLTVWYVVPYEFWQRAVSTFTKVYELSARPDYEPDTTTF